MRVFSRCLWIVLIASITISVPAKVVAQSTIYRTIPTSPEVIAVNQSLDFPCWSCLAIVSDGGGKAGATSSIFDLHVISNRADQAFPRALVARIESECASCQPAAMQIQARGNNSATTVWAANFEAYSQGRASVAEFNIGAALGGYVLDIVPTRLADSSPSAIDAVMKVEGFGHDPAAARVNTYIDAKINPQRAIITIPDDQGPVTVMQTADGRMKEVWEKTPNGWISYHVIDGARRP